MLRSRLRRVSSTSRFRRLDWYGILLATCQSERDVSLIDMMQADGSAKSASPPASSNINGDVYIADGDYIKDIEVNDLRNRYTLTKGATQKMVNTLVALCPLIFPGPSCRTTLS